VKGVVEYVKDSKEFIGQEDELPSATLLTGQLSIYLGTECSLVRRRFDN